MTEDEIRSRAYAMPICSPAYPKPPFRFVDREFIIVTYRTDPEALARIVPAPLLPTEPIVKYEFIKMPDSSGLGSYMESGQVIPVSFNGAAGGYTHAMYLDSEAGIASGRELLGFPKVLAQPRLEVRNDALVGTLDYNGVRVATATMAYKYEPLDLAAVKKTLEAPGFLLKILPHVDGSARVCELVKYHVTDVTVKGAWTGPASLELHPHCFAPVAKLPVLEVLSAIHILTDLTIAGAEVVHDYLRAPSNAS
ncbi:acetoacetate decarboxylase [Burkholderia ubonensis]|uniref:Acetoacetate decarboxylase n=1 Tax=Burkholderia ubonensis TaxID=101571 RepID=A0A108JXN3_9BURK|nr:acetoacetate decarboxylase [Burkholderia ubonensis]AOK60881.1 acetoacetate decarboxylase [Burkholderia ubonensis]KVS42407.1 acetoacetate decarboxylase [Burkholderia ubonensis]KVS54469.1 acetoacetate decarboxylase [Burkholderia ubonensis]KVS67549.1 acetoacetate decarboxylase [Burkholderia ubonensis]KVS81849.1 acetoacetate decarboxylase [Burkholderia ubonensis]